LFASATATQQYTHIHSNDYEIKKHNNSSNNKTIRHIPRVSGPVLHAKQAMMFRQDLRNRASMPAKETTCDDDDDNDDDNDSDDTTA